MRIPCLCVLLLILLTACGTQEASHGPGVVATISGHRVTEAELQAYTRYASTFDSIVYPESTEARCTTSPHRPACVRFRSSILARLLEEQVILAYARQHHLWLSAADKEAARTQLQKLMEPSSPSARLFHRGVSREFVSEIVRRQLLVQRVEESVVGSRVDSGPEFHIRRIGIPLSGSAERDNRRVVQLATGGRLPAGSAQKTVWMAPFRMAPGVRQALESARPGDYVGPFSRPGYVLVIKLIARGTHRYASPAREQLASTLFRSWVQRTVEAAHPKCMTPAGKLSSCPHSMMNTA
jgi:hypothetical protein